MKTGNNLRTSIRESLTAKSIGRINETKAALNELSSHTLGRYIDKATKNLDHHAWEEGNGRAHYDKTKDIRHDRLADKHGIKANKRHSGILYAANSLGRKEGDSPAARKYSRVVARNAAGVEDSSWHEGRARGYEQHDGSISQTRKAERHGANSDISQGKIRRATKKLVTKVSGMPHVSEQAVELRAADVLEMAASVLSNFRVVQEAAVDPEHEAKEKDHKIKMVWHVKGNGLHAKTHNGKVYKLNPKATGGLIPRVDSYLTPGQHDLVEGMVDYPDNAEPAYSPQEVQAMLNTFKRNSSIDDKINKTPDYSRVTIDPNKEDEEKKIEEEIVEEIAAEMEIELNKVNEGVTDSFDVEFDDGGSFEIDSAKAAQILRAGSVKDLVRAGKSKAEFESYIKKIGR